MKGGERKCSKCVHGPSQDVCDVYGQARQTFAWMPYGDMYCRYMKHRPIISRAESTARRWASEPLEGKRRR